MLPNPLSQATIERLKTAEPAGGYKDIGRAWYFAYFGLSTLTSIAAGYFLSDLLPAWLPQESPFFIAFSLFMIVGFMLMRRWGKKHQAF